MNYFFNSKNQSRFLANLGEIEKLAILGRAVKAQNGNHKSSADVSYFTIPNYNFFFFDQGQSYRSLCSPEIELVYLCLSTMLGFTLNDGNLVKKRLEQFKLRLRKINEKYSKDVSIQEVVTQMQSNYDYFKSLSILLFESNEMSKQEFLREFKLSPEQLNILALQNTKQGSDSKAQLLLKRALLRAKLINQNINYKEYVDDIYKTNTETKMTNHKSSNIDEKGSESETPIIKRAAHHNEEYLLFNSGLLLLKRKKHLEAVEVFHKLRESFKADYKYWYRFGQASKGVFMEDLAHVSTLYDYYFHNRKKKFYSETGATNSKSKKGVSENSIDDFISFFGNLVDNRKSKTESKRQGNSSLRDILIKKKLMTIFKAKNLLSLTNKLYSYNSQITKKNPGLASKGTRKGNPLGDKNLSVSSLTLEEPSLLTKNNIFTVLTSLKKSIGVNKLKLRNNLHEINHLNTALNSFAMSISLIKRDIFENFRPILKQIKIYKNESLINTYKTQLKRLVQFALSCYENLSFLQILKENFFEAVKSAQQGLDFLANVEKGFLGFAGRPSRRLKISLKDNFLANFRKSHAQSKRWVIFSEEIGLIRVESCG